jgi:hypothetical protein
MIFKAEEQDNSFFTLRCWRDNAAEREYVRKLYSTKLLTPRERRTIAAYHASAYLHLHSAALHYRALLKLLDGEISSESDESRTSLLIDLEIECCGAARSAWSALDAVAHEINLICWKQAGRKDLYHPYVQEKKISLYMVRQKLLASDALKKSAVARLLDEQTRCEDTKDESYTLLSCLAMRSLHRPLLLGCRFQKSEDEKEGMRILLTESEGMPRDKSFNLHDVDLIKAVGEILRWLENFIDQVYKNLFPPLQAAG